MHIVLDDLRGPEIHALLQEHLLSMALHSPPESVHALDLEALRRPEISFWTAWEGRELLGCGALKDLGHGQGEVKSMRTATAHLRRGVARKLLEHIVAESRTRAYRHLFLETGSAPAFVPAHRLYANLGFEFCGPFGAYCEDPYSVFMRLEL